MKRWLLTGAVAAVACGGSAIGQAPRPAADGPIILMKTAGQPDRRVQVIRSERAPDGKVLTEVKDLGTGEVYTMVDINPGGDVDAQGTAPPQTTAPRPILGKVKDALPRAKDRPADSLLGSKTGTAKPAPAAEQKPGLFGRVFGSKPAPVVQQPAFRPAPAPVPMTPVYAPAPAPAAPPTAPIQASATVAAPPPLTPSGQMREEIAQSIQDLRTHHRPSFRMEAATALTDGRYAGRDEVKMALATAAKDDPAGMVRGHCIDCLSKLGYADPEYVRRLQFWTNDIEPAVQRAAHEALAKLAPKP